MNDNIQKIFEDILQKSDFKNNPYFVNLVDGDFSKEDFIETQVQFYHLVRFFPRILATFLSKIPESPIKMNIIENLYEEHGEGFVEEGHENTFFSLLNKLEISKEDIEKRALWPETRELIFTLWGTCSLDNYLVSAALLGAVEYMFWHVSKWIEQGILKRNWLKENEIIYYMIREKLDVKHALDFFELINKRWEDSPEDQYCIKQGLELACHSFSQYYSQLYKNRKKRKFRSIFGPHIIIE